MGPKTKCQASFLRWRHFKHHSVQTKNKRRWLKAKSGCGWMSANVLCCKISKRIMLGVLFQAGRALAQSSWPSGNSHKVFNINYRGCGLIPPTCAQVHPASLHAVSRQNQFPISSSCSVCKLLTCAVNRFSLKPPHPRARAHDQCYSLKCGPRKARHRWQMCKGCEQETSLQYIVSPGRNHMLFPWL